LSDIPDPSVRSITRHRFGDTKITHLEVGYVVHRNLKVHVDGTNLFANLRGTSRVERDLGFHALFGRTRELFQVPHDFLVLAHVFRRCGRGDAGVGIVVIGQYLTGRAGGRVGRQRYFDGHVGSKMVVRHFRSNHKGDFELVGSGLFDGGEDAKGDFEFSRGAVVQYHEFTVRWNERECPGVIEFG